MDIAIIMIAVWLYVVGSLLVGVSQLFEDDPWWMKTLAIVAWPVLFPVAMLMGLD